MQAARDCLGEDSAVARALAGFRPRPEQQDMAAAVEEALAEGRHLFAEAGTGVGKSFAYLVPVLQRLAGGDGGPIVVATRTIALQEQLVRKDIPLLRKALGLEHVPVRLAQGPANFACRRRLGAAHAAGPGLLGDPSRHAQIGRIREWAEETEDGTLADLPFRPAPEVWELVRAESGNCLHRRCPWFGGCTYQRARRELHDARLVVANHALVFSDLALREQGASLLPDYEALILDEAHEAEDSAADNFGAVLGSIGVARLLGRFTGARGRNGLFGRAEAKRPLWELAEETREAARRFFDGVAAFRGDKAERRITGPGAFADPLSAVLGRLVKDLRDAASDIEDPGLSLEWRSRTDRLDEALLAVRLVHGAGDPDYVYWVEGRGRAERSVLRAAPAAVAPILKRGLFGRARSVVCTSATLRVGASFAHLASRLGAEEPDELALGSPFDFRRQCRLILFPRLPDPREPSFEAAATERIRQLVTESGGGAFVLFTAYGALGRAHDALKPELEKAGLRVLRQGADLRTRDIVEAFRERSDCVLFATDTFWQGIDVRGNNLRLVILAKLPFAVPDHPLQQARLERIEADGGDPFRELSLPQAVLKLRQGFGRLIRSHEDTGTVAILDPRIRTRRYGRVFLDSLPACAVEERD